MTYKSLLFCLAITLLSSNFIAVKHSEARSCARPETVVGPDCDRCGCNELVESCQNTCMAISTAETGSPDNAATTLGHISNEFEKHRTWIIDKFFKDSESGDPTGLLAAMQLMAHQFTNNAVQQVHAIGKFFDAKHQLETQALFSDLKLDTHQNFSVSTELCEVGTLSQSLMGSQRKTDITSKVISKQIISRQLLPEGRLSEDGQSGDYENRLVDFINLYCNKRDNNQNLDRLCMQGNPRSEDMNRDINYTDTVDSVKFLDLDFIDGADPSRDEKAIIALSQNLYGHRLLPYVSPNTLVTRQDEPSFPGAAEAYLDARALMAKRSVATNSYAAITALKTKGETGSQPFIYALINEMTDDELATEDIVNEIGLRPSYHAQMEILTKKLYQRPEFYSELYDKPANVLRKNVALQAATLMQKRDLYQSYLRSEMTLAVMLETLLMREQKILETNMSRGIE